MLKMAVQRGRSARDAEASPLGYVEDLSDARTKFGERCASAHLGRVGEKGGVFSILLNGAADGVVAVQILDGRVWSAETAGGVLRTTDLTELHLKGIVDDEFIRDRFADA